MLTPSSNTVLEPVTSEMLREVEEASAHFGRFAVTRISLSEGALAQFATPEVVKAAELLGHARCQVIGWSGTSSSWLGFDTDAKLCQSIESTTGAKGCTSVLAMNEILEKTGAHKLALVMFKKPLLATTKMRASIWWLSAILDWKITTRFQKSRHSNWS